MRPMDSFIEQPVRSLQTMLRVISADDPMIPTVVPDGIYGPATTQAIFTFQRQNGIAATGITDQITWEAIVQEYEDALIRTDKAEPIEILIDAGQVFRRGDTSPFIYLMQSMLIQLALEHASIPSPVHSGILDDETEAALIAFQQLSDLPPTGELDRHSWKHLVRQYVLYTHHINARSASN